MVANRTPKGKEPHRACDVMEVCGGHANISRRARKWRLRAGPVFDIEYGWDLLTDEGYHGCLNYARKARPRLIVVQLPCKLYCWFNYAINYKDRRHELLKLRYEERRLVELCVALFELQISRGDHAMLENPGHSELFDEVPLSGT